MTPILSLKDRLKFRITGLKLKKDPLKASYKVIRIQTIVCDYLASYILVLHIIHFQSGSDNS